MTIFSKIVAGEIPCYKIAEDENFFSFLDISPIVKGHTLVIPKLEVDYIFDLDDSLLAQMAVFTKKIASALGKTVTCKRVGVTVMGLQVPHAHIHLLPINSEKDMNFSNPHLNFSEEQFQQIAASIRANL